MEQRGDGCSRDAAANELDVEKGDFRELDMGDDGFDSAEQHIEEVELGHAPP